MNCLFDCTHYLHCLMIVLLWKRCLKSALYLFKITNVCWQGAYVCTLLFICMATMSCATIFSPPETIQMKRFFQFKYYEITPWLRNPEVQCRIHKGSPIILSWAESTLFLVMTSLSLRSILILSYLCLGLPRSLFQEVYLTNFWKHFYLLSFWLYSLPTLIF